MQMFLLFSAAMSFSVGGYFMKLSEGFTQSGPIAAVLALFCLGAGLQMVAMRNTEMTVTYIIVLGLEAVTACTIGALFLNEGVNLTKLLGILIIVVGIAILRA